MLLACGLVAISLLGAESVAKGSSAKEHSRVGCSTLGFASMRVPAGRRATLCGQEVVGGLFPQSVSGLSEKRSSNVAIRSAHAQLSLSAMLRLVWFIVSAILADRNSISLGEDANNQADDEWKSYSVLADG